MIVDCIKGCLNVTSDPATFIQVCKSEMLLKAICNCEQYNTSPSCYYCSISNKYDLVKINTGVIQIEALRNQIFKFFLWKSRRQNITSYKIFGTIELGETGCIYRAINSQTNQMVILKRETFLKGNEGVPCSVIREISFLKEMEHMNIVKLLDIVNKERSVYLVMEYMDHNLRKYIMDTSLDIMMKPRIIKNFLHQTLDGLAYCHSNKILHRGLKHESLLLDHGNQSIVKIADFGTSGSIFCSCQETY
ncbi:unnamed protein product [Camellia sinensis]